MTLENLREANVLLQNVQEHHSSDVIFKLNHQSSENGPLQPSQNAGKRQRKTTTGSFSTDSSSKKAATANKRAKKAS